MIEQCSVAGKVYWQIAAGDCGGRDYIDDFVRYGLAFVGGTSQIAKFSTVKTGDILLLRNGLSDIIAAGTVVERDGRCGGINDKLWLHDYDGWDLPAYSFVEWHVPASPVTVAGGLTRGTIKRVYTAQIQQIADQLINTVPVQPVEKEPVPTQPISDVEILNFLIREGLRPRAAEELTTAFRQIRLLADYYCNECGPEDIHEHETRSFLIIPLLLALGWAEQKMKIELGVSGVGRVDIACFENPYKGHGDRCKLIIESKGFSFGLGFAHGQAKQYADHFPTCQVVVVSNGYCYKAYTRADDGSFPEEPTAYLNLLKPMDKYPLAPDKTDGALCLLKLLLP